MVNRERKAAPRASAPYFVLGAFRPQDMASESDDINGAARANIDRFLADWVRRCLPLPLCSATSERVFEAYRFWCQLQSLEAPVSMNGFITAADRAGFERRRHCVRQNGSTRPGGQHVVLHPPTLPPLKSGDDLDLAASAFTFALARWRQSAGEGAVAQTAEPARQAAEVKR